MGPAVGIKVMEIKAAITMPLILVLLTIDRLALNFLWVVYLRTSVVILFVSVHYTRISLMFIIQKCKMTKEAKYAVFCHGNFWHWIVLITENEFDSCHHCYACACASHVCASVCVCVCVHASVFSLVSVRDNNMMLNLKLRHKKPNVRAQNLGM
jgi:hypothetical protein